MKITQATIKRGFAALSPVRRFFLMVELALLFIGAIIVTAFIRTADVPAYASVLPIAAWILVVSFTCDAISHVAFKKIIPKTEHMVHDFIIYGSVLPFWASCLLAFRYGVLMLPFSIMFGIFQIAFVAYDEFGFHWKRSIRVEQLVHYGVILGAGMISVILFLWAYKIV